MGKTVLVIAVAAVAGVALHVGIKKFAPATATKLGL